MDHLFGVGGGYSEGRPFLDRTSVTIGPISEDQEKDGAGNAGAVVQAKHGSPTRRFAKSHGGLYGLAYSLGRRHQQLPRDKSEFADRRSMVPITRRGEGGSEDTGR